jgi:tryptophan halogenase
LHYKAAEQDVSDYWCHCREMGVPDNLAHRIKLFTKNGAAIKGESKTFRIHPWTQVMLDQRIQPKLYNPIVTMMNHADYAIVELIVEIT